MIAFKRLEDGTISHLLSPFVAMPLEKVVWWESGVFHGLPVSAVLLVFISMPGNWFHVAGGVCLSKQSSI